MEGLIKGLIHVAIDAIEGGDHNAEGDGEQRRRHQQSPPAHPPAEEERIDRSTWAEVVSEGKGQEERPSSWNVRKEERQERRDEEWEEAEGRRHHHHQQQQQQQYQSDGKQNQDWQDQEQQQQQNPPHRRQHQSEASQTYKRPPSQQDYSEDVHHIHQGLNVEPSREELDKLSKACSRLWELDLNRLVPGKDYRINIGEGKKVHQHGDMAPENLFTWLSDDVLKRRTYSRFIALLDNYNPREGYKEVVTAEDRHEQVAFIEEISRTAPIKYLHRYLDLKGVVSHDYEEFKQMITSLWFDLYGRGGGSNSSSAFEHVFVGEIKGRGQGENEVSGFHNWIQFYVEETKGNVNYQGYILPRRRGEDPDAETQLLTIQFEWHGILKSISSTLVGVSPEFEVALYTLCFFAGGEDNLVHLGPYSVDIKCYHHGNNKIGSVFPISED